MADLRDDDRVSGAYRELPGDGPSPALDAAIQAAARRAVGSRPGAVRRWQIPVSIAAVLALAIGISLQVDREKPMVVDGTPVSSGSAEYPVPAPDREEPSAPAKPAAEPAPPSVAPAAIAPAAIAPAPLAKEAAPRPAKAQQPIPEAKRFAPEPPAPAAAPASPPAPAPAAASASAPATAPAPAAARAPMQTPSLNAAPASTAAPPAAAGAVAPAEAMQAAPQPALRAKKELMRDATTQEKAMSQALETPERRLERIADLRAKGLHDEADRALAEFRRAYPDYRLGEEWLRKVERR